MVAIELAPNPNVTLFLYTCVTISGCLDECGDLVIFVATTQITSLDRKFAVELSSV